jgi:superfamily II DNA or RNA helicase
MADLVKIQYNQTGESVKNTANGMRPMAARAFEERNSQYLLIKAPPASGKSRALMFIALDKLINQGLKKAIIAVPERSIASSFADADLISENNFFAKWDVNDQYNLCTPGSDGSKSKVEAFKNFMANDEKILICTHATLRFAFDELDDSAFDNTLLAIDEFHHVSADVDNRLGELLRSLIQKSTVHIVAMTGSYFRGDTLPVLKPEDEAKFKKITYNYYEQLNGYKYLKSLGIGYVFYTGPYVTDEVTESPIHKLLDTNKKTIIHIPSPNAGESTLNDKYHEVDLILDGIGSVVKQDEATGIIFLKRSTDGKILKVADLVQEDGRDRVVNYLRNVKKLDDLDLIIALGMAKEGFDWPFCEHALTVGYRGSLTEIIQIIGRCTRDSANKTHSQFTNLIAAPDSSTDLVKLSVNNMLKAITASLLMEQVLGPNFNFKTKLSTDDKSSAGEIKIEGLKTPSTSKTKGIVESDLNDLKAAILQDDIILKAIPGSVDPEVINKVIIPKIIQEKYPTLTEVEIEEVRQYVVLDSVIKNNLMIDVKVIKKAIQEDESIKEAIKKKVSQDVIDKTLIPKVVQTIYPDLSKDEAESFSKVAVNQPSSTNSSSPQPDTRFVRMAGQFVNIDDLSIDLIDSINPFQKAYGILSKSITPKVLKVIQEVIESTRIQMTLDEAMLLWPKLNAFVKTNNKEPNLKSNDPLEVRMAEAIIFLKEQKRKAQNG